MLVEVLAATSIIIIITTLFSFIPFLTTPTSTTPTFVITASIPIKFIIISNIPIPEPAHLSIANAKPHCDVLHQIPFLF